MNTFLLFAPVVLLYGLVHEGIRKVLKVEYSMKMHTLIVNGVSLFITFFGYYLLSIVWDMHVEDKLHNLFLFSNTFTLVLAIASPVCFFVGFLTDLKRGFKK